MCFVVISTPIFLLPDQFFSKFAFFWQLLILKPMEECENAHYKYKITYPKSPNKPLIPNRPLTHNEVTPWLRQDPTDLNKIQPVHKIAQ